MWLWEKTERVASGGEINSRTHGGAEIGPQSLHGLRTIAVGIASLCALVFPSVLLLRTFSYSSLRSFSTFLSLHSFSRLVGLPTSHRCFHSCSSCCLFGSATSSASLIGIPKRPERYWICSNNVYLESMWNSFVERNVIDCVQPYFFARVFALTYLSRNTRTREIPKYTFTFDYNTCTICILQFIIFITLSICFCNF